MVKKFCVSIALGCLLIGTGWAATPGPSAIATPPQPKWVELSPQQKSILAPLSSEWDALEHFRRKKWLGITQRFPELPPEEQRRIQTQMHEWAKLTPTQRREAREQFQTVSKLPPEKKQALKQKWEEYSNLPEEEKQKLAEQAARKTSPPLSPPLPTFIGGAENKAASQAASQPPATGEPASTEPTAADPATTPPSTPLPSQAPPP